MVFLRGVILVLLISRGLCPRRAVRTPARRLRKSFADGAGRSLDQKNTTTKVGRTTIREERFNVRDVQLFRLRLDKWQDRNRFKSGIRHVSTVLRRRRSRIHRERAVFHHAARSWRECRQTLRLPGIADDLFLSRFLSGATVVRRRSGGMTTLAGDDCLRRIVSVEIGGRGSAATAEKASASHPNRDAEGQQQPHGFH